MLAFVTSYIANATLGHLVPHIRAVLGDLGQAHLRVEA